MSLPDLRKRLDRIERAADPTRSGFGRLPAVWLVTHDDADRDRQLADLAAAGTYAPGQILIDWRIVRPGEHPRSPLQ